jgi:hypothetical protein
MIAYRRYRLEGGCYLFTVALAEWRKPLLTENIQGAEPFSVFQKLFEQREAEYLAAAVLGACNA